MITKMYHCAMPIICFYLNNIIINYFLYFKYCHTLTELVCKFVYNAKVSANILPRGRFNDILC